MHLLIACQWVCDKPLTELYWPGLLVAMNISGLHWVQCIICNSAWASECVSTFNFYHYCTYFIIRHILALKCTQPAKVFTCPSNIWTSHVKVIYTAGKISMCPSRKITCLVAHATTKFYVPWDKIYMPWACRYTLISSPDQSISDVVLCTFQRASWS